MKTLSVEAQLAQLGIDPARCKIGPQVADLLNPKRKAGEKESKRPKYNNRIEGRYRSKREAAYARELDYRLQAKEIAAWHYEPARLVVQQDPTSGKACRWTPDFMILHVDGSLEFVEIKGFVQRYVAKDVLDARARYPFWKFTVLAYEKGAWLEVM